MKDAIARIATERGESEAVILREAIKDYLANQEIKTPAALDLTKAKRVSYLSRKQRKNVA